MFIVSCTQEGYNNEKSSNEPTISRIDGRLAFKDMEAFNTILDRFDIPEEFDKKLALEYQHTSLFSINSNESLRKGELPEIIVEDDLFATVLNDEGYIQIEDIVFNVSTFRVAFTHISHLNELKEWVASNKNNHNKSVMSSTNISDVLVIEEVDRSFGNDEYHVNPIDDWYGGPDSYDDSVKTSSKVFRENTTINRILDGEFWNTWWAFYSSYGFKTDSRRRRSTLFGNDKPLVNSNKLSIRTSFHVKGIDYEGLPMPDDIETNLYGDILNNDRVMKRWNHNTAKFKYFLIPVSYAKKYKIIYAYSLHELWHNDVHLYGYTAINEDKIPTHIKSMY